MLFLKKEIEKQNFKAIPWGRINCCADVRRKRNCVQLYKEHKRIQPKIQNQIHRQALGGLKTNELRGEFICRAFY